MAETTTIYARYRRAAGLSQERAAELLGCAVSTVGNWEYGINIPSNGMVTRMMDIYAAPTLGIEHLRNTQELARDVLPAVEPVPLAQAVTQLLYRMSEFNRQHRGDALLWISSNGMVDPGEQREVFTTIAAELQAIVQAAMVLKYAGGGQ